MYLKNKGGISTQRTLPYGQPQDVKDEVDQVCPDDLIRIEFYYTHL